MARAYYNEIDPFAAAWLRNLIEAGHIARGDVDERSIADVQPGDLAGYTQCHFFAGIGGWSLALRLAGWDDARSVWTGSCPCQPFSQASRVRKGTADKRHLWPDFRRLIAERGPANVFGEQVASKDGRLWLAGVRTDLEGLGYAVGAADLCAAGEGSPHIRQRLFWLADAGASRWGALQRPGAAGEHAALEPNRLGDACRVADTDGGVACDRDLQRGWQQRQQPQDGRASGLGDACGEGGGRYAGAIPGAQREGAGERIVARYLAYEPIIAGATGFWSDFDILGCTDGKARRIEPGSFPLAHGIPGRVGKLRAFGNAIVPQVAAEFIGAYLDATA